MRKRSSANNISVHAIAGTQVVLLGIDAAPEASEGLLGFTISKRKGDEEPKLLRGGRGFEGVHSAEQLRAGKVDSSTAPIQAFMWSDYVVDPNHTYTYKIEPVYGAPDDLEHRPGVEVTITTEDPEGATHGIYFNRGVAGSASYSRRFGEYRRSYLVDQFGSIRRREFVKPSDVPDRKAYKWLSRGLEEAMMAFLAQAEDDSYALRAAVYEFTYAPAIQAFVDALERGVDVKIVHHAKRENHYMLKFNRGAQSTTTYEDGSDEVVWKNREGAKIPVKEPICQAADRAVSKIGLKNPDYIHAFENMMIERTDTQISHNKFVILLKDGKPIQVWTGSTNFTDGGIFGQSNVGHVVRDEAVAARYYDYWQKLSTDPKRRTGKNDEPNEGMADWTVAQQHDLDGPPPPNSVTPIFSPRATKAMLDWYADRMDAAQSCVFFTAAFTVANELFDKVIREKETDQPYMRYLLLESKGGKMREKYRKMSKVKQNRIAWGDTFKVRDDGEEEHLVETLTGLNTNVAYLHTKYMLIDPLSDDPIVITGSANFSEPSTTKNDENMLVIRGNTRIADIFLGEFMRLFNHFHIRNVLNRLSDSAFEKSEPLAADDSWTRPFYKEGTQEHAERLLFR